MIQGMRKTCTTGFLGRRAEHGEVGHAGRAHYGQTRRREYCDAAAATTNQ